MEVLIKIITFCLFICQNTIRLYYFRQYLQQHKHIEKIYQVHFEKLLGIWLGILYTVPLFFWWFTDWLDFSNIPLPAWIRISGVSLSIASILLFYLSHKDLGINWSPLLEIRTGHKIIQKGVFRYIRHPMYASLLLGVVSVPLLTANILVSFLIALGVGVFVGVRLPREEAFLQETFGENYKLYQKKTKKLIPYIW